MPEQTRGYLLSEGTEPDRITEGQRKRRLRFEFKPQDAWIGAFWKHSKFWGGSMQMILASAVNADVWDKEALAHRSFDLWVCLLPMVPLHFSSRYCPQPDACKSGSCWAKEASDG